MSFTYPPAAIRMHPKSGEKSSHPVEKTESEENGEYVLIWRRRDNFGESLRREDIESLRSRVRLDKYT